MKRILFAFAMFAFVLGALPRTSSADVGIDFFYDNLSGGNWFEVADYGYCWQPDIAVNDPSWRPYADGYWAYTDVGWTWISYEDFGWATYHYGRWARLADYGWVWVPGADLEWGPAWVSWRTGGDYIGWAPLPPRGPGIVYEGGPIGFQVDVDFDIGPDYYNFCDVRYIGEPVLRQRIVDVRQNVTFINQTVNVTNITVNNNVVYNYGPNITAINQRSSRPVQQLRLERQENVDVNAAVKTGGVTKVQGNSLVVAAPMKITKPAQPVAPPAVKAKVTQAKIEKGWAGVDPNKQAQIKQKLKTEDHTKIPPPTTAGAATGVQPGAAASPAAAAAPTATGEVPGAKGRKGKRGEQPPQIAPGAPAGSPGPAASPGLSPQGGRHIGRRGEQPGMTPPVAGPTARPEETFAPGGRRREEFEPRNVGPTPGGALTPSENLGERQGRRERLEGGTPGGAATPSENLGERQGRRQRPEEGATPGSERQNFQGGNPNQPGGRQHRPPEEITPPRGQAPQGAGGPNAETQRGARRQAEEANPPAGGRAGSPTGERRQEGKKGSPSPGPQ